MEAVSPSFETCRLAGIHGSKTLLSSPTKGLPALPKTSSQIIIYGRHGVLVISQGTWVASRHTLIRSISRYYNLHLPYHSRIDSAMAGIRFVCLILNYNSRASSPGKGGIHSYMHIAKAVSPCIFPSWSRSGVSGWIYGMNRFWDVPCPIWTMYIVGE